LKKKTNVNLSNVNFSEQLDETLNQKNERLFITDTLDICQGKMALAFALTKSFF